MKILAIETATEALSVAVLVDGALHAHHEVAPRRHGELLLPAINRVLGEAGVTLNNLDAIAFGRGPGAFTGVRIAIAAAQGLAFGANLPLVPVSTLAALAQSALDAGQPQVLAAIDARMGEVYAGRYIADPEGLAEVVGEEWVGPPETLTPYSREWAVTGTGGQDGALPTASAVARIAARELRAGRSVPLEEAMPVYLRDKVAVTKL